MVPLPFAMWLGEHDGVLTVRLAGRLEAPWSEEVRRDLERHCPSAICLDLSALTSLDAQGLRSLVAIRQDVLSGGGRFGLYGVTDPVRFVFAAAGLDALVDDEPVAVPPSVPITRLPRKGDRVARRAPAATTRVA